MVLLFILSSTNKVFSLIISTTSKWYHTGISNEQFVNYENENNNNFLDYLLNVSCDSFNFIDSFDINTVII